MTGVVHLRGEPIVDRMAGHRLPASPVMWVSASRTVIGASGSTSRSEPVGLELAHLQAPPFIDVAGHRVGELERPLFVELHQGERGDRLGHRIDAPDRVVRTGLERSRSMRPSDRQ